MTAFLICVAIGFAITLVYNISRPQALIRGLQEGHYGGTIFYFAATSIMFALPLWVIYLLWNWLAP